MAESHLLYIRSSGKSGVRSARRESAELSSGQEVGTTTQGFQQLGTEGHRGCTEYCTGGVGVPNVWQGGNQEVVLK